MTEDEGVAFCAWCNSAVCTYRMGTREQDTAAELLAAHARACGANPIRAALTDLLARTQHLDDAGPRGEEYQSDALVRAIANAIAALAGHPLRGTDCGGNCGDPNAGA